MDSIREFSRFDGAGADEAGGDGSSPGPGCLVGMRLLVVDDDRDSRELAAAILRRAGAEVGLAGSGTEALFLLEGSPPDLLVCDLAMPGYDGFDLIRDLRGHVAAELRSLPAIALSGMPRPEDRQRALDCGFDQHLSKPVNAQALVTAVAARHPSLR